MGEQFRADIERLRATAPAFEQLGAEVAELVGRLQELVSADIAPWGADDTGKAFAQSFVPEEKQTLTELDNLTEVLRRTGQDLRQVAANVEHQDLQGGQVLRSVDPAADAAGVRFGAEPVHAVAGTEQRFPADSVPESESALRNSALAAGTESPGSSAVSRRSPEETPEIGPARTTEPSNAGQQPSAPQLQSHSKGSPPSGASAEHPASPSAVPMGPPSGITAGSPVSAASPRPTVPVARAATGQAGRSSAAGPPGTPWSRGTPSPGVPRVTAPGSGTSEAPPPRMPVRPPRHPGGGPEDTEKRSVAAEEETLAARLARELAEQHGVRAFGFDTPGVARTVLLELVAAVNDVLPRHPAIGLRAIGIADLDAECATRLDSAPADNDEGGVGNEPDPAIGTRQFGVRITLAADLAVAPAQLEHAVRADEEAGILAFGSGQRPVYSSIVRELGRALDAAGGFRARSESRRALLAAYLPLAHPRATITLARTVAGFKEWRAQLTGGFRGDRFDPADALAEAFTEVVLDAGRACAPARVLHRLLVEASEPGRGGKTG